MIVVLEAPEIINENPRKKMTVLSDALSTVLVVKNVKVCNRPYVVEIFLPITYLYIGGSCFLTVWMSELVEINGN